MSRMTGRTLRIVASLAAGMSTLLAARADDVLVIDRHAEWWDSGGKLVTSGSEEGTLYLGAGRARFDQGPDHSWILLSEEGRLLLLDHGGRTYQELEMPVSLEALLAPDEREKLAALVPRVVPEIERTTTDERREIGGWLARKVVLAGKPPEGTSRYELELWLAEDLPTDHRLHGELLRSFGALHLPFRGIAEEMAGLPGFPVVRRSVVTRENGSREVDHRQLRELSRREVPASLYEPPRDYRLVPFDPGAWITLEDLTARAEEDPAAGRLEPPSDSP